MPTSVRAATVLMWLVWISGVAYGVTAWLLARRFGDPGLMALGSRYLTVFVMLALLIRAVMNGRNWARMTYSVLALIAGATVILGVASGTASSTGSHVLGGALVIAYSAILVLLFHSTSSPWFRKHHDP